MKTFWCRYMEPFGLPAEHMLWNWPAGMVGWKSGYSDKSTIWCARVDASSPEAAEEVIRSCYGESGKRIEIESTEEMPLGWRPSGGRFPE